MHHLTFEFVVEGLLLFTVACIGMVGNTIALLIFTNKKYHIFYRLMLTLCLYDLVYLMASMMIFSLPLLWPSLVMGIRFTYSVPYLLPIAHIAMTGSIYTTMAIAIERYITICHPFFKISHNWSPSKYIIPILVFSIAYNVPKFLELEVMQLEDYSESSNLMNNKTSKIIYTIQPTKLRMNETYIFAYMMWSNFLANGVFPFMLLIFLNISIYSRLRKMQVEDSHLSMANMGKQRVKEMKLAQVSLVIVFVFISCHTVKWIPNIWELQQAGLEQKDLDLPVWIEYVSYTSSFLTTLNGSTNVFIYFFKHKSDLIGSCIRQNSVYRDLNQSEMTLMLPTTNYNGVPQQIGNANEDANEQETKI